MLEMSRFTRGRLALFQWQLGYKFASHDVIRRVLIQEVAYYTMPRFLRKLPDQDHKLPEGSSRALVMFPGHLQDPVLILL